MWWFKKRKIRLIKWQDFTRHRWVQKNGDFCIEFGPFFCCSSVCGCRCVECRWFCWLRETPGGQKCVCSSGRTRCRELTRWFIKDGAFAGIFGCEFGSGREPWSLSLSLLICILGCTTTEKYIYFFIFCFHLDLISIAGDAAWVTKFRVKTTEQETEL